MCEKKLKYHMSRCGGSNIPHLPKFGCKVKKSVAMLVTSHIRNVFQNYMLNRAKSTQRPIKNIFHALYFSISMFIRSCTKMPNLRITLKLESDSQLTSDSFVITCRTPVNILTKFK